MSKNELQKIFDSTPAKSYKDKVLRDHSKMLEDLNSTKRAEKRLAEKRKKAASVKKATGGRITKKKK